MKLEYPYLLALAAGALLLVGCASSEKKAGKEATLMAGEKPISEETAKFEPVGVVTLVNAQSRFVLIEGHVFDLPIDLALKTFEPTEIPGPQGETGVLKVSLERAGRFVVADIVEGMPGKGDVVYR